MLSGDVLALYFRSRYLWGGVSGAILLHFLPVYFRKCLSRGEVDSSTSKPLIQIHYLYPKILKTNLF